MRIADALRLVVILGCAGLSGATATAFDGTPSSPSMARVLESARQGTQAARAGKMREAVENWTRAAEGGDVGSLWELGRLFSDGSQDIQRDDLKAFHFFSQIVETHGDEEPSTPQGDITRRAFVKLGSYYLEGIPGTDVRPDPGLAWRMFYHAASVFGDAEAQYQVGRMYLTGAGGEENPRMGANWLRTAADKGHPGAMATLGELLFMGRGNVLPRRPVEGLMWLTLARGKVKTARDAWIVTAFEDAWTLASDEEHRQANALVRRSQLSSR